MPSYTPIRDVWICARPKVAYYGAYPAGALGKMRDLLGVHIDDAVLHVCGGRVRDYPFRGVGPNDRTVDLDLRLDPDFLMDVRFDLPAIEGGWPGALVDAPYSSPDAAHYACGAESYPEPNALLRRSLERVRLGGRVGFLHYKWPRPPKELDGHKVRCVYAGMVTTGHDANARHYTVFEKVKYT